VGSQQLAISCSDKSNSASRLRRLAVLTREPKAPMWNAGDLSASSSTMSSSLESCVTATTALCGSSCSSSTRSSGIALLKVVPGTSQVKWYSSCGSQQITSKSSASTISASTRDSWPAPRSGAAFHGSHGGEGSTIAGGPIGAV